MDKANEDLRISDARFCADCRIVTADATCPLCNLLTVPHPEKDSKEAYCMKCSEGPFTADKMRVLTWNENPHMQDDEDGGIISICRKKCVDDD